jgi:hypothetical protein
LLAKPLTQEINMKARVIALVALALGLAIGLPATVASTGPTPARTVAGGSMSLPGSPTDPSLIVAGPGGCCP